MALTLKSIAQFRSDIQQGILTLTEFITDFSSGSVALAVSEAVGRQLGFVQAQGPVILSVTRAATSIGPDLDSFVADYYLAPPRLPNTYATGFATFHRNQVSLFAQVLLDGTIIQNATPSPAAALQYVVIADPTDPTWSATAGGVGFPGRTLIAGQVNLGAKIQAVTSGKAGNVIAGTLTVIASPSVPFDTVTNPNDISNGQNAETDAQLRQRFSDFISTKSGTRFAIAAAVMGVQAGLSFTLNDLTYFDGTARDGNGTIVVDDGSGAISAALLTTIQATAAAATLKSFGARIWAIAPTDIPITVTVTGTTIKAASSPTDVRAAITAAIVAYVNTNGVGGAPPGTGSNAPSNKLSYVGLANLVASFIGDGPLLGLASYGSVLLNGAQADVPLTNFQLARTSTAAVSVT